MFDFLKPKCCRCNKIMCLTKYKDGIGGGFSDPICWECVEKSLNKRKKQGDKK